MGTLTLEYKGNDAPRTSDDVQKKGKNKIFKEDAANMQQTYDISMSNIDCEENHALGVLYDSKGKGKQKSFEEDSATLPRENDIGPSNMAGRDVSGASEDAKRKGKFWISPSNMPENLKADDSFNYMTRKGKQKVLEEEENADVVQERVVDEVEIARVCGICLTEETSAFVERGKLDCCDHFFCFGCIMEWAKVESRCPMCKQRFVTIVKPGIARKRKRTVRIPTRNQVCLYDYSFFILKIMSLFYIYVNHLIDWLYK